MSEEIKPRQTCDKPCCNGPEPEEGKPWKIVKWHEYGYTPREAMEAILRGEEPKQKIPPTILPGDV